jgi:hypothetical protein
VSGKDIVRTIKGTSAHADLPVMFVVHRGQEIPAGLPDSGTIEIDRIGPARLLASIHRALGVSADPVPAAPADLPPAVQADPGGPTPLPHVPTAPTPGGRSGPAPRIVLADTVASTRAMLESLGAALGWEIVPIDSAVQTLRVVRDSEVDAVLINPALRAAGLSGADIARSIKGAAQFRKLPVLFVLHADEPEPAGAGVDGTIEVDRWPKAQVAKVLGAAMGRAVELIEDGGAPDATGPVLAAVPAGPGPAPPPAPEPAPVLPVVAAPSLGELRAELLADIQRAIGAAMQGFIETEGRSAIRQAAAAEARTTGETALRDFLATEARNQAERIVASIAREIVPALAERAISTELAGPEGVGARIDEQLRGTADTVTVEARRAAEATAHRLVETEGRRVIEEAVRHYVATDGARLAAEVTAAAVRETLPALAERLLQEEIGRLPSPSARVDAALAGVRAQLVEQARHTVDAMVARLAETEGRDRLEASLRAVVTSQPGLVDEAVRAVARDIVPAVAERLIQTEIGRLREEYGLTAGGGEPSASASRPSTEGPE